MAPTRLPRYGRLISGTHSVSDYVQMAVFMSLNDVLFPMFCLLVEGECQILVF